MQSLKKNPCVGTDESTPFKRYFCQRNSGEPEKTQRFVASDLILHCLPGR